jgi:hypothetical protein
MKTKLKFGLISLIIVGVAVGIVLTKLSPQLIKKPGEKDEKIPKQYKDPFYCDETVKCGVGTIQGDPLRSECVNEYHSVKDAIGPSCECLNNKCASAPIWISTNDPNHQFTQNEEIMFTFAIGINPIYGSKDRWLIFKFTDGQWLKVFENRYSLACSTINKDFKAFWLTSFSGEYKVKFTYFTDSECKNTRTTEREFKITE